MTTPKRMMKFEGRASAHGEHFGGDACGGETKGASAHLTGDSR
jgi:hypothetical protein